MRKLKVQVQASVDGYMASVGGDVNWAVVPWSHGLTQYVASLTESVDCILIGRHLAEGFIPAWAARPEGEPEESIDFMNETLRAVFSNTLTDSPWPNAEILGGDLAESVGRLKEQEGGDIITYGGGRLVSGLLANRLVDELHLIVNPVAIGRGMPIFGPDRHEPLDLASCRSFDGGVIALQYRCT